MIPVQVVASPQVGNARPDSVFIFVGFRLNGRAEETRFESGRLHHRLGRLKVADAIADFRRQIGHILRPVGWIFSRPSGWRWSVGQAGSIRPVFGRDVIAGSGRIIPVPLDVAIQVIVVVVGEQVSRFGLGFAITDDAGIFRRRLAGRKIAARWRRPCRRTVNNFFPNSKRKKTFKNSGIFLNRFLKEICVCKNTCRKRSM